MRTRTSRTYLFLFFTLLGLLSIPQEPSENLQGTFVAFLAPAWKQLLAVKTLTNPKESTPSQPATTSQEDLQKLQLENTLFREEILHLKNIMQHELGLLAQMESLLDGQDVELPIKSLKKRHSYELKKLLQIQLQAVPARVLFRSSSSWDNTLWINVGTETNAALGTPTIAKNSPVLVGTAVIGVVDFVGKKQSRVRLITDPGLNPSVRTARGNVQHHLIREKINALLQLLYAEGDAFEDPEEHESLLNTLEKSAEGLYKDDETAFLAKGELQGASTPRWRAPTSNLKGSGFNYDFADQQGPARDLRSGKHEEGEGEAVAIVKNGDILVTTGLDGVFPPGLPVAVVTKVHPLKEGDYYYDLDAMPAAGNLDDLSLVFVIPPIRTNER